MRLVTRGDLDGLACAVLITSFEKIEETVLVHPQDITDKRVPIDSHDIVANLPYHPDCGMWFDHHLQTASNAKPNAQFKGKYGLAASAAHLIWEYYGRDPRFARLVSETNRLDSANLSLEDVVSPQGYILLGYTLDSRTGLGNYRDYFMDCLKWVKTLPIEEVLEQPDVWLNVKKIKEQDREFRRALLASSRLDGNVIVTDFRPYALPPIGNRFLVYTLYPEANVSLRLHWGPERRFVVAAVGHSIFNRTCNTSVGELMSRFGGGGHRGAGTTPLPVDHAEESIAEILRVLKKNG